MTTPPLSEDTAGDKAVRFVIGAMVGAVAGVVWRIFLFDDVPWAWAVGGTAAFIAVMGAIAGNRFIEGALRNIWRD